MEFTRERGRIARTPDGHRGTSAFEPAAEVGVNLVVSPRYPLGTRCPSAGARPAKIVYKKSPPTLL